jgi:hypothetical protein
MNNGKQTAVFIFHCSFLIFHSKPMGEGATWKARKAQVYLSSLR